MSSNISYSRVLQNIYAGLKQSLRFTSFFEEWNVANEEKQINSAVNGPEISELYY